MIKHTYQCPACGQQYTSLIRLSGQACCTDSGRHRPRVMKLIEAIESSPDQPATLPHRARVGTRQPGQSVGKRVGGARVGTVGPNAQPGSRRVGGSPKVVD